MSWGALDNTVYIEWESTAHLNGQALKWRGIDKITLRDGRIEKEVVYSDNLYLWEVLDSKMKRPALIDADSLGAPT